MQEGRDNGKPVTKEYLDGDPEFLVSVVYDDGLLMSLATDWCGPLALLQQGPSPRLDEALVANSRSNSDRKCRRLIVG